MTGMRSGSRRSARCCRSWRSSTERLPKKWDSKLNRFVPDDDWLLWDFHSQKIRGKHVESVRK